MLCDSRPLQSAEEVKGSLKQHRQKPDSKAAFVQISQVFECESWNNRFIFKEEQTLDVEPQVQEQYPKSRGEGSW